jgi:exonuclease III
MHGEEVAMGEASLERESSCESFIPFEEGGHDAVTISSSDSAYGLNEDSCAGELLTKDLLSYNELLEERILRNKWAHRLGNAPALDYSNILRKKQEQEKAGAVHAWLRTANTSKRNGGRISFPQNRAQSPHPSLPGSANYDADADEGEKESRESEEGTPEPVETSPAPEISATELLARGYPKFALSLEVTVRYCIFNVGHISKRDFWQTIKTRLAPEALDGVIRVESVLQPNGRRRMDIWVASRVAPRFKQALYLDANAWRNGVTTCFSQPLRQLKGTWFPSKATRHWRIDMYRTWRDRGLTPHPPKWPGMLKPRRKIATFNVNGIWNRKTEVEYFLQTHDIGILAIQETLIDCNQYDLRLPGYEVYERSKTSTFRGQALAIHKAYTSYEVGKVKNDYFIHVKVVGLTTKTPWHIIAVYMPSGGNYRSARTACFAQILAEHRDILKKEPDATIVILGDFNTSKDALRKIMKEEKTGLTILKTRGNPATFHRHRDPKKWSAIDSIVVSSAALKQVKNCRVERHWGTEKHPRKSDSDHFPLMTTLRQGIDRIQIAPPVKFRYNVDLIKGHGKQLVFSNRWDLLPVDPITTTDELDEAAVKFTDTINMEAIKSGIKQAVGDRDFTFHRDLKKKVGKTSWARKEWLKACKEQRDDTADLKSKYEDLKLSTRKAIRTKEQKMRSKEAVRVTRLFRDNEMKAFHRWESENAVKGGGGRASKVTPVKDANGVLLTGKADILKRTNDYYKDLLQDDPDKLSRNRAHWAGKVKAEDRRKEALDCNQPITWRDVLDAIRRMALGTSPGDDDIPIELYKAMLKEECHQHCRNKGTDIGDGMYVALPLTDLPENPCTPMGIHLKRIIDGMWKTSNQPKAWSTVTNVSLHKSGDPTDLLNYRGISLITVGMKIFTVVLSQRISRLAELNHLYITEQGGFREGQEAIAQFIALAEIVRRRRLKDLKTWVVFIDFKKAFDKVMHEALFEKMDAMGFRGQFLDIIRNIYSTSAARTRVGGEYGVIYDMIRGTRQGCPLSPILFLLFINDFLTYVPAGVEIPLVGPSHNGGKPRTEEENQSMMPMRCPGLLFADDVAGLTETEEEAKTFLAGVTRWSQDWGMPMGAQKCGVMLIGGTEEEQLAIADKYFEVDGQRVMVVRGYKYLGIWITDKLGDKDGTDETGHCKSLAAKVKQATDMRRAFLRDRRYPIALRVAVIMSKILSVGCYGGEWIAMCQRRTGLIQKELNTALKIVLGSSTRSNLHAMKALSIELGVPTIEERTTEMRIRLWQKCSDLKTWLKLLSDKEYKLQGRVKVWTSGTSSQLLRLQPRFDVFGNVERRERERLLLDRRVREMRASVNKYDFIDDPTTRHNKDQPDRLRQEAQVAVTARALHVDLYTTQTKATIDYISFGYDRTRKYLQSAVYIPSLTEGTTWLTRLRTGGWWTTKRRFDVLKVRGNNHLTSGTKCPCCGNEFAPNMPEFAHILLDCRMWETERNLHLRPTILAFLDSAAWAGHGVLNSADWKLEAAVRLLGGCIFDNDYLPLYKTADMATVMDPSAQGTPSLLDYYAVGWGGNGEVHLPGLNAHGYTSVAKFLALVMPRHKAKLFPNGSTADPKAYQTTECEDSPVKRPLPVPRLRQVESEEDEAHSDVSSESDPETVVYPHGRLSYANQADALRGMGTRCKHVSLPLDFRYLAPSESDEYSVGDEPHCHSECGPRLFYDQ